MMVEPVNEGLVRALTQSVLSVSRAFERGHTPAAVQSRSEKVATRGEIPFGHRERLLTPAGIVDSRGDSEQKEV